MKSPIEEFAEAKKSGAYAVHPETQKNWPDEKQEPITVDTEKPTMIETNLEKEISRIANWLLVLTVIVITMFAIIIAMAYKKTEISSQPLKEAPPKVIVKTKTKVKKVYVARSDKWRKRLCYNYGDWSACTAYKKNLPSRARVGRTDLN